MNYPKKPNAAPPDKPLFLAIMGVFFLIFSLAPAYWAFYNKGRSEQTQKIIQLWSQHPEAIPRDAFAIDPLIFQKSMQKRYNLEMKVSGASALILLGIALLFFKKAQQSRSHKAVYDDIDWRVHAMPTAPLKVEVTTHQDKLIFALIAGFVLLAALILYQTLTSRFSSPREVAVKMAFSVFLLLLLFPIFYLIRRAKRRLVASFDATGVTRGDGRHFSWAECQGVVTRTAPNRFFMIYVWRKELVFWNGEEAWIIPQRIKNYNEVCDYLAALPPATLKS